MKINWQRYVKLPLFAILLASGFSTFAITNTTVSVSGTNLVLSWPSYGYESYLIQYRQTLSPTDSWSTVTNAYPANSTSRTTFNIFGIVTPQSHITSHTNHTQGPPPPAPAFSVVGGTTTSTVLVESPNGGTAPLALYPPGFNLSGLTILDPNTGESVSVAGYTVNASTLSAQPLNQSSGSTAPTTGFYRVYDIPDWLVSLSGSTNSGPTFIPVNYSSTDAPTNYVDDTTLLINGQPTDYASFMSYPINGINYWGMGIDFERLPNGTNTIQLLTTVRENDLSGDDTTYMVFSNAPQTIIIANAVTFTNWSDLIWNNTSYTFQAQSTVPGVNWEIDIYDINGYYVNSQTGYSANGNISWTWNLTDYNGNLRSDGDNDPFFYPYITVTTASGNALRTKVAMIRPNRPTPKYKANTPSNPNPMPAVAVAFPSVGGWVVSYMDNFYSDGRTNYDPTSDNSYRDAGINAICGAAAYYNMPFEKFAIAYGRTYTQTNRNTSWSNLKSWLYDPQYRNFYYFGHGAPNIIGGDINKVGSSNNIIEADFLTNSTAYLKSKEVYDNIGFNPNGARPYRFVFLDACNTANGNFAPSFGIPNQSVGGDWYLSSSNARNIRPSAFMGWSVETGDGPGTGWGTPDQFWSFRNNWIGTWVGDTQPLSNAIYVAGNISNWVPHGTLTQHLITFGDLDLQIGQYNFGGDWP